MPHLGHNPTLPDIQKYVSELEQERGFANQDAIQKCLMLGEEVGELFKAIRKQENMSVDSKSQSFSVQEEMADIIIMLCSIANRFDVNLEEAFRNKEEINKKRKWTTAT
ncbi:MAG: MazG nucleotide pyrophosphohydrolase domain-containing protein [Pseudobdellovibrionaceae bacterium]